MRLGAFWGRGRSAPVPCPLFSTRFLSHEHAPPASLPSRGPCLPRRVLWAHFLCSSEQQRSTGLELRVSFRLRAVPCCACEIGDAAVKTLPGLKSEHQEGSHRPGARHVRAGRALGGPASHRVVFIAAATFPGTLMSSLSAGLSTCLYLAGGHGQLSGSRLAHLLSSTWGIWAESSQPCVIYPLPLPSEAK